MQDEPEPENQEEEHQSYSVYEQAQRYRAAKAVLQDIYALDAEHADAVKALDQLWEEGYTVAAHQLGKFYRDDLSTCLLYTSAAPTPTTCSRRLRRKAICRMWHRWWLPCTVTESRCSTARSTSS